VWTRIAESALARLWLLDEHRKQITEAADRLEAVLRRSPHNVGESRAEGTRIAFEAPLAALYEVRDKDRTVTVLRVWGVGIK
jgi:hypothetical protein